MKNIWSIAFSPSTATANQWANWLPARTPAAAFRVAPTGSPGRLSWRRGHLPLHMPESPQADSGPVLLSRSHLACA